MNDFSMFAVIKAVSNFKVYSNKTLGHYPCVNKKDPATRIRTRDRPMAALFIHYSRTLYQLSYCRKLKGPHALLV